MNNKKLLEKTIEKIKKPNLKLVSNKSINKVTSSFSKVKKPILSVIDNDATEVMEVSQILKNPKSHLVDLNKNQEAVIKQLQDNLHSAKLGSPEFAGYMSALHKQGVENPTGIHIFDRYLKDPIRRKLDPDEIDALKSQWRARKNTIATKEFINNSPSISEVENRMQNAATLSQLTKLPY